MNDLIEAAMEAGLPEDEAEAMAEEFDLSDTSYDDREEAN